MRACVDSAQWNPLIWKVYMLITTKKKNRKASVESVHCFLMRVSSSASKPSTWDSGRYHAGLACTRDQPASLKSLHWQSRKAAQALTTQSSHRTPKDSIPKHSSLQSGRTEEQASGVPKAWNHSSITLFKCLKGWIQPMLSALRGWEGQKEGGRDLLCKIIPKVTKVANSKWLVSL